MVEVWLPYGKTEVCIRVPTENLLDVIEPKGKAEAQDPQAEIENALTNPISTESLAKNVKPGDKVAIALKDSGASSNRLMVSAILKVLNSAGTKDEDVTVIVAYDPCDVYAVKGGEGSLLGEEITSRIRVMHHDCETSEHVMVGETSKGTRVYLNKAFVEANVKILASVIEPHIYAGYSGGRDAVLPGISKNETILHNLLLSLNPKSKAGILEDNPVHEDMVEAAHLARANFALNLVRDSRLGVVKAFAGDVDKSFDEGVKLVGEMCKVSVEKRADVTFVGPGGAPLDADLLEACKAISSAAEVTRRGGAIVLMAECAEGYGNSEFYGAMSRFKEPDALEKSLKKSPNMGGFMAYRLMKALQRFRMYCVSTMPDYYVSEVFRLAPARTANEALRYAFDAIGKRGKVSVVPYGNCTLPQMKSGEEIDEGEKK